MYPKENRLRKTKEFQKVFRANRKIRSNYFAFLYLPNKSDVSRFGLVVSKKVGKAHVRNLVKRRMREVIRTNMFNIPQGFDYVIVAYPQITDLSFQSLQKELTQKFGLVNTNNN